LQIEVGLRGQRSFRFTCWLSNHRNPTRPSKWIFALHWRAFDRSPTVSHCPEISQRVDPEPRPLTTAPRGTLIGPLPGLRPRPSARSSAVWLSYHPSAPDGDSSGQTDRF
jgi:hypothetical protein